VGETIFCHEFPNGLVLIAEPMSWLESVTCAIRIPAGSIYDREDLPGLAAFSQELTLRGAGGRDSRKLIEDLNKLGIHRVEDVSSAHAKYAASMVASKLPAALAILADIVRRPHLLEKEVEPIRRGLLQDLQGVEDEPLEKLGRELRRRYYPSPWGRPSDGEESGIERIQLKDVQEFHGRHYQPNKTIISIAGRFDWSFVVDLVGELFGDWPAGEPPPVKTVNHQSKYGHIPFASQQVQIGIAYPCVPYRHPDYFVASAAVGVLGGGTSARLFMEVRERRGLCYSVYATYHTLRDWAGVFCFAGTTAERAQETLDVLLSEIRRLGEGIRPDELQRLKARIKSGLVMLQESSAARAMFIARDWYHLGRVRSVSELSRMVDELSCEGINDYLKRNPPGNFTIVTVGPRELEVPDGVL